MRVAPLHFASIPGDLLDELVEGDNGNAWSSPGRGEAKVIPLPQTPQRAAWGTGGPLFATPPGLPIGPRLRISAPLHLTATTSSSFHVLSK